jgi:ATP-dependent DNA helicase RecQ
MGTNVTKRSTSGSTIRKAARERFGYDALRPGQEEAIRAVIAGRDVLAVFPTGAGKSAIYQIAGALIEGPTVVVSPLIALQRDQEEAIEAQESGGAARMNSSLSQGKRDEALEDLAEGDIEFVLLAPEQFANPHTLARLRDAHPSLIVVDEAHCISDWGFDFRPDYLRLASVIEELGRPRILALTAAAAPPVRDDIVERLGMTDPAIFVHDFDRPNIFLAVDRFTDEDTKREDFLEWIAGATPPGIVYVATRARAEDIATALHDRGSAARAYHAGLPASERDEVQSAFMDGAISIIVATSAFGMGIDKPDVRFVAHFDVSESVDAYYQEFGRAGRDGAPAEARLFFLEDDLRLRRFFAAAGKLDAEDVVQVAEIVAAARGAISPEAIVKATDLPVGTVRTALARLDETNAVSLLPSGDAIAQDMDDAEEAADEAAAAQARHRTIARTRVEMMRGYAEANECRRAYLLNYFGEAFTPPCNACDVCLAGLGAEPDAGESPFAIGSNVVHARWGAGTVVRLGDGTVTVLFEDAGYRTLDLALALAEELLTSANQSAKNGR